MAILEYSKADILRNTVLPPDWYRVRIDSVEDKVSKNGDSINSRLIGSVLCHAESGDEKFAGVPTPFMWQYNTKAPGFATGLWLAVGEPVTEGERRDTQALAGKTLEMFIGNELYQSKMQNCETGQFRKDRRATA